MIPELLDQIYESAFVPEHWPRTLEAVAGPVEAVGASIAFNIDAVVGEDPSRSPNRFGVASESARPIVLAMSDPRYRPDRFASRLMSGERPRFVGDDEVFGAEDYEVEPMLRDLFVPQNLKWGAGTIIRNPFGTIVFGMRRRTELGPFDGAALGRLDALRPHIARSALMAARLHLVQARAASQTLAALGLPALVCDAGGAVVAANALVEQQADVIQWRARDRFALRDAAADRLLREALAILVADTTAAIRSFPVRGESGGPAMVAHVVPMRRTARDLFGDSTAALVLTPVAAPRAPPPALLQSLFDLTPSEAEVAGGLALGRTVAELAGNSGVSTSTIRTHVRGVLEKTGVRRQTDVVALMAGLTLPTDRG